MPIGKPWRSNKVVARRKAFNNSFHEPHGVHVGYFFAKNGQERLVINRIKKLLHIAFQSETRTGEISTLRPDHTLHGQHSLMRSFADTARKGVRNKSLVKKRIQNPKHRMVQYPIPGCCLVDVAHFWIPDIEAEIRLMGVFFRDEFAVKCKEVLFNTELQLLYIFFMPLIRSKFFPCRK